MPCPRRARGRKRACTLTDDGGRRIGEKFLEWSDADPPLDAILESVSLYWFTQTFPRAIWPYRVLGGTRDFDFGKPLGYSSFPKEIATSPPSWVKPAQFVWYREHERVRRPARSPL